jgi:general secretion pathway protein B
MSFILDALKKSESDRQRQSGPALFEVRVAPPRNSLPLWAIGLAVLLAVNLVIVAWVLLRRPAAQEQPAAAATGSYPGPNVATANPSASMANANVANAAPQPLGPPQGPSAPQPGFGAQTPSTAVPVAGAPPVAPVGQTAGMTQQAPGMGQSTAPTMGGAATNTVAAANDAGNGPAENPDDYAPAADPAPAPFGNRVTRSTPSGVPLYQDAAQTTHLPTLHLDLHVFAASPEQRFVMINTRKLREGDSLPEGVRVESITPDGAVLSLNGTRFLLPRE